MKQITISDAAYNALAQRHGDVAAFVEQLGSAGPPAERVLTGVPDSIDVNELIRSQAVQPIGDFRSLKADFVPAGETTEAFLATIDERRRHDSPAAG